MHHVSHIIVAKWEVQRNELVLKVIQVQNFFPKLAFGNINIAAITNNNKITSKPSDKAFSATYCVAWSWVICCEIRSAIRLAKDEHSFNFFQLFGVLLIAWTLARSPLSIKLRKQGKTYMLRVSLLVVDGKPMQQQFFSQPSLSRIGPNLTGARRESPRGHDKFTRPVRLKSVHSRERKAAVDAIQR